MSILAEPAPSAKEILESVRMKQSQQQIDLRGQLRQNNIIIPFQLIQSGGLVRYIFTNPDESLQLEIGEEDSQMQTGGAKAALEDQQATVGEDAKIRDAAARAMKAK